MAHFPLLAVIGRLRPEVWDAIVPHGPGIRRRFESVALNPQPLPPKEREDLALAAGLMANRMAHVALESELRGEAAVGWIREAVADWCETPWPRRWPWPWPGPRPEDGPQPDPWKVQEGRIAGALVFASVAARLGDGELKEAFRDGAEKLAEASLGR